MENIFFVSGLPRSGSTLLMNLLGQNPNHYVTPTSGLIELFVRIKNQWKDCLEFKAEGYDKVKPRVEGSLGGILTGYFRKELAEDKVCFDKSRGWLQYIEDVENCLGRKIKVLVTVRDPRDILASFEKLYRNRGIEYHYPVGKEFFQAQTVVGRAENLLLDGSVVGITINRLRDAILRGVRDRLVLIPYHSLTNHPKETLNAIHNQLGLEPFDYDPDNVDQITVEDDLVHGIDLHKIQSKVLPGKTETWRGILPDQYAFQVGNRYADIINLLNPATYRDGQIKPS